MKLQSDNKKHWFPSFEFTSFFCRVGIAWISRVGGKPDLVMTLVNLGRTWERIFVAKEALLIDNMAYLLVCLFPKPGRPTIGSGCLYQCFGCHGQRKVRYEWPSFTSIRSSSSSFSLSLALSLSLSLSLSLYLFIIFLLIVYVPQPWVKT